MLKEVAGAIGKNRSLRIGAAFAMLAGLAFSLGLGPVPALAQERSLTLADCLRMALENNLDIQISRYEPEISQAEVDRQMSLFDSFLSSGSQYQDNETPAFVTGQLSTQKLQTTNASYTDTTVSGLSYSIDARTFRTEGTFLQVLGPLTSFVSFGPIYDANLSLNVTQPLLRDRGVETNKTQIHIAQNGRDISDSQFRQKVIDTLKAVESTYWELVFAIRDLEVREQSLARAERFLDENRVKVEVGTLAPIEITTAEAEVASRLQDVIVGRNAVENAEDNLRIQISSMETPIWEDDLVPLDRPPFAQVEVNLEENIDLAMENRPDLEQQRLLIEGEDLNINFFKNQRQYELDVVGGYSLRGQIDQAIMGQEKQGFSDAWEQVFNADFPSWNVGLNFVVPFSNREAKSQFVASRLRKERSLTTYDLLRQQATQEVRRAVRQIDTDRQRVEAGRVNVRLQREKLDAEQKKYENGMSTSFQVLTFQEDLAEAERTVARALIDYNIALAELDRVNGTLHESRGVVIE